MARVAENQDRALEARRASICDQTLLVRFLRSRGHFAREERSEYAVIPTPAGFEKRFLRFSGKYENSSHIFEYSQPHHAYKDVDLDGELISDLSNDLTSDPGSRDGIAADLFPLTARRQQHYEFTLAGRQTYRGAEVFRIRFQPRKAAVKDGAMWAGEVLVDAAEFQPVFVSTRLAQGIPLWVRTLLGTNLKHLGFALIISYQKVAPGVWFPSSYGGEFELSALFFYKRHVTISLHNRNFRRAGAESRIEYLLPPTGTSP